MKAPFDRRAASDVWDAHWELLGASAKYDIEALGVHYGLIMQWLIANTDAGIAKRILEPGCGTGKTSFAFARAGKEVHLLDISRRACEVAARGYRESGVSARIVRGDVRQLPYADGTFDLVWNHGVIEHFPDPPRLVIEMQRVTRPGGWTVVLVPRTLSWWVLQKNIVALLAKLGVHHGWSRGGERSYTGQQLREQLHEVPGHVRRVGCLYCGNTLSLSEILRGLRIPGLRSARRSAPIGPSRNALAGNRLPLASRMGNVYRAVERVRRSVFERIEQRVPWIGHCLGQEWVYAIQKPM